MAVPATRRGGRERGRPVFAVFRPLRAVNFSAQRFYPVLLGGVEHPYVANGIPFSAETARPGRKIGVVRRVDDDMAVPFHDRERHPTPRLQRAFAELGAVNVNIASRPKAPGRAAQTSACCRPRRMIV